MTEREKMLAGLPYDPGDPDLRDGRARAVALTVAINAEPDRDRRGALVNELVNAADGKAIIMPGFFCDYGVNIHLGARAFANANCVFLDCAEIRIGDNFQAGPGVQLLTPEHPLDAVERRGLESARPITIGARAWVAAEAFVGPGVTVGEGAILGARAVAMRDLEPWTVHSGNPAVAMKPRVMRESE